jgi:hypothetical protein
VRKQRGRKALRVLIGTSLMALFVVAALAIVMRYAGGWGVPYFSFTTERGSRCQNTLTGYVCEPPNLADVEYFGDISLPADTQVVTGIYRATHDYQLDATLAVPAPSAARAMTNLTRAFGKCRPDQPSPIDTRGLRTVCVMATNDAVAASDEPSSRVYSVVTGLRGDGTRVIGLSIHSR